MEIEKPLEDAIFVDRPNRFLTIVAINGERVESHLPDPGRLQELLVPGASLKVRPVPREERESRKTNWTTVLVRTANQWVSIDSTLPNRFVKAMLDDGELPMLKEYSTVRTEVTQGHHRYDFLLEKNGRSLYLEVKSVTLVEDGVAMFPDAVTSRGARHVAGLADLARSGEGAGVLFVCQRPDAFLLRPQWNRDPRFAEALVEAEKHGVKIWAITAHVSPNYIRFKKEIPYNLSRF